MSRQAWGETGTKPTKSKKVVASKAQLGNNTNVAVQQNNLASLAVGRVAPRYPTGHGAT